MFRLATILAVLAGPALAQEIYDFNYCEDLWWQRNQFYNLAGKCFATPLGQVMYDNSDCVAADVPLSTFAQAMVRTIRQTEAQLGCAVDTSRTTPLDIVDIETRRAAPWIPGEGGEWFYYYHRRGEQIEDMGWADHEIDWTLCASVAG